jgi:MATE family multidrug resistance protein
MQIKNFTTMIPTGVAFAASGLVGNCIGMNQISRGKEYASISIKYSMFVTFTMLFIFWMGRDKLARIFTEDPEIVQNTKDSLWSLFLYIFASTIKGVQNGVVRALGLQKRNSFITLLYAYGMGIPLAAFFCFQMKMGLSGMWFGISIANATLVFAIDRLINKAPWDQVVKKSQ